MKRTESILKDFRMWWIPRGRDLSEKEYNVTIDAIISELQLLKLSDESFQRPATTPEEDGQTKKDLAAYRRNHKKGKRK